MGRQGRLRLFFYLLAATFGDMARSTSRLTNLALLCVLTLAFASGWIGFELSGQPARAILVIHAAAGVAIVLFVPWKSLIARRGLRHPRPLRWASLVLAVGVLVSLAFGFVHSFGRPNVGYLTAMDFHVGAALCAIPFFVWHVLARPAKLRPADLSRRNFLKGAALVGASILGAAAIPGARRAPTGSFLAANPIPTQWMFDSTPEIDSNGWSLLVAGRSWTYDELLAFDDRVTAVLDCTGGWYSEQSWEGVWLQRLLPAATAGTSSVNVRSITGFSRRFAIDAAPRLLLATRLDGIPLDYGHGYPVRLVVPRQRGFAWVKWLASVDVEPLPSWWQPPFPIQ
jgi:DMSO/TMAO reductase YedYZ molybdopterin-dependent catalytic subunit